MYEQFEHTADLGLRIRAPDKNMLFAEAAQALTAVMVEDVTTIEPREKATLIVTGDEETYRMLDWLALVLIEFETDRLLFREFRVKIRGGELMATCRGERYDPAKHHLSHEVKAITYHGLVVKRDAGGWLAEVIVDI